jgi:phosphoenolpyruvate phosphomutase
MSLISKTIKIKIEHERWLESHPEINFSEWIRKNLDKAIEEEHGLKGKTNLKAIIVAAGHDKRIEPLNENLPKCMLEVKGKTILGRQIESLKSCGINDIVIIKGYKQETIDFPDVKYYLNPDFENTGIISSLFFAEKEMNSGFIFLYSDIIFDKKILNKLLKDDSDISLVVDLDWKERYKKRGLQPSGEVELVKVKDDKVVKIGKNLDTKNTHGEFIGLAKFTKNGAAILKKSYKAAFNRYKGKKFHQSPSLKKAYFIDMIQELIENKIDIKNVDTYGDWMEIDTFDDYKRAWSEVLS